MTAQFSTSATVTDLLNAAQDVALRAMDGAPATPTTLLELAARIKGAILTAAALGEWVPVGVRDPDDLMPLVVTASYGNALKGEPPIKVDYDFTRTAKPLLQVESIKRKATT